MKTLKKSLIILSLSIIFSSLPFFGLKAGEEKNQEADLILLSSPGCPHCTSAKNFIKKEHPNIALKEYNLGQNTELANNLYDEYSVPSSQRGLVPTIFIDDVFFVGFNNSIAKNISNHIAGLESEKDNGKINLGLIGEVDIYSFSLPVLTAVLGIVDGFNVCSLGALVIILGLVLVLKSRRKIILLGGTFILVTVLSYSLLIFLWHQFFSFISPYIRSMELLIGILAVIAGIYLLREFVKSFRQGATCGSGGIIAKLTPKIEKMFSQKKNVAILLGVIVLFAVAVTIIEFPCSAFLPVLFTSILVEAGIPLSQSLFYIGIYLFLYMLAEIIIFLIAVFTMRIKIISPKFMNLFSLIAAIIFLFLGSYYLFRFF
jgi:glutaredoxin